MEIQELYDLIVTFKDASELGSARVDARFDGLESRFDRFESRYDEFEICVETRFDRLETRIERVEDGLVAVRSDIAELKERSR